MPLHILEGPPDLEAHVRRSHAQNESAACLPLILARKPKYWYTSVKWHATDVCHGAFIPET